MLFKKYLAYPLLLLCAPSIQSLQADSNTEIGIYFWGGALDDSGTEGILGPGHKLLEKIGSSSVRIAMSPRSDPDYGISKNCIANFSLTKLAERPDFKNILSNPKFETIMITAYDDSSGVCNNNEFLNPDFYTRQTLEKIEKEYREFASYLNANFPDKFFIISNWEGDNSIYCGSASNATAETCPDYGKNMEGFTRWINARTRGIKLSGATNVYSAIEFNSVKMLRDKKLPDILHDVLPIINADFFSYSAYESTNQISPHDNNTGDKFTDDIKYIREILSVNGFHQYRLIIGELGFNKSTGQESTDSLKIGLEVVAKANIKYTYIWNLLNVGGNFGLFDGGGELTQSGEYLCKILKDK
ncbi:MAG: hypothetical protein Q8Q06_02660 [bacterium]|nr:hypothetical protein [bacterium]